MLQGDRKLPDTLQALLQWHRLTPAMLDDFAATTGVSADHAREFDVYFDFVLSVFDLGFLGKSAAGGGGGGARIPGRVIILAQLDAVAQNITEAEAARYSVTEEQRDALASFVPVEDGRRVLEGKGPVATAVCNAVIIATLASYFVERLGTLFLPLCLVVALVFTVASTSFGVVVCRLPQVLQT